MTILCDFIEIDHSNSLKCKYFGCHYLVNLLDTHSHHTANSCFNDSTHSSVHSSTHNFTAIFLVSCFLKHKNPGIGSEYDDLQIAIRYDFLTASVILNLKTFLPNSYAFITECVLEFVDYKSTIIV